MPTGRVGSVLNYLRRVTRPVPAVPTDGDLLGQFVARREESAFAALVARHGPMVLGVCQRVLQDAHDAEDAFQATFLVLVRQASAIRKRASVGSWLYGVAYRTALSARKRSARRRVHERQAQTMQSAQASADPAAHELRPLLDAELAALPDKYRAPLVLCYLEGKTNAEAARQLGWTRGTVSGRLARARELLRRRLARRGLACTGSVLALALSQEALTATVPPALAAATVHAAALTLAGAAPAVVAASAPATLAQGVLNAMFLTKLKTVFTVALLMTGLGVGGGWIAMQTIAAEPAAEQAATAADDKDPAKLREENARLRQELAKARREIRRLQDQLKQRRDEAAAERKLIQAVRERAEFERQRAEEELRRAQEAEQKARLQQRENAGQQVRQAGDRNRSANILKQIGIAMHNYHDTYKKFPPAAIVSNDGKPLLSWRVAILPFIDQEELYKQFKLDEPWDSEHNKKLLEKMPEIYAPVGVKTKEKHTTFYQVFVGKDTIFDGNKAARMLDITDGTSNTVLAVEAGEAVPWTKPADLPYDAKKPIPKLGGLFKEGFHVLVADGSVRFVRANFNERVMRVLITRNDGQPLYLNDLEP